MGTLVMSFPSQKDVTWYNVDLYHKSNGTKVSRVEQRKGTPGLGQKRGWNQRSHIPQQGVRVEAEHNPKTDAVTAFLANQPLLLMNFPSTT